MLRLTPIQLQARAKNACTQLGLDEDEEVAVNLYKMVLYKKDGHFKPHRDTEKEPGMFGTLIIQLPVRPALSS